VPVYQKAANGGPEQAIDWQGLVSGELGKLFRDWLPVDVPEAEALQRLSFPREERADGGPLAVLGKTSDTPDDQTLGAAYRQLGLLIANELDWGVFESTSVEQEERGLILEDSTSTTLIEQVKAGKQDAWVKFVDLYGPLVYRWCREKGQGPEEAQDIGQEVFRKVATHISSYHRDRPGSFCGWLRVITKNAIVDFSRQSQKQPDACGGTEAQILFGEVPDPVDDELDDTAVRDDVYLVHRALDQVRHEFADNVFQAFSKMTIDEYSSREVAEELNMTPNSVRQAKFRVLQRLRELLADVS
jgi:RNA polymerase sigma-70 factor (ECF subfamily)